MTTINCLDKNGIPHNFKYFYEVENDEGMDVWKFMVIPESEIYEDFFFFSAKETVDNCLKVTMINNHNQIEYSAKGIPERIIQELRNLSNKVIISSSNNPLYKSFDGEFRTPPADKFWNRLVTQGKASYDIETDTYKLE
jgi:hypothetical protein